MKHCGTQTIETERLILRRLRREDAAAMFRNWTSDPEVTKYLTWPTHESVAVTEQILDLWMKNYENDRFYQWGIELRSAGEVIGSISVVGMEEEIDAAAIGYCIGRNWWHQGITSEALAAVIQYLFREVGCNRIEARHDVRNPHSGGVMQKCGMRFEGVLRSADRNNQGIGDIAQYAILKSDPGL